MAPRVQTFAWRLLRKALPTGLRASRFSSHISKQCCRCDLEEDDMHLFFRCTFARASWFAHPWYLRSDLLTENHLSMQSVLHALLNMNHPYASISNIFNFLWCIWKSRNDCLFARKMPLPHQVHIAASALAEHNNYLQNSVHDGKQTDQLLTSHNISTLPQQGCTVRTDLLISGAKIYSDAAFNWSKIPGLVHGTTATGVGVFLCFLQDQAEVNVQIQASTQNTSTPLQAEALAFLLAAQIAHRLHINRPTFLTDCLSLAKAAAERSVLADSTPWSIRKYLAEFFSLTKDLQAQVFHISREINGIAHNVAHQVLRCSIEPDISCFASAHSHRTCPVVSLLSNINFQGYVLHAVRCY